MEGRRHPLTGLRVLEMGSRVAAPYVGKLFADAGADVCKVESPAGDQFRRWSASGATIPVGEDAAWFRFLNGGKRSVVVDLGAEGGRDELLVLVAGVDLVLDDHDPADARALGITADDLRAVNPAVVVATLTPFGTTGPWADRPANDFVLQALVGSTEVRGMPGEEPVSVGGDLGDFTAAAFAAPAALAATLAARASGRGVHVDCSQYEAMMHSFQVFRPMYESMAPDYEFPRQFMIPSIEPASDGMVAMCCVTGQQWQDFCTMIGAPEFGDDPMLFGFIGRLERKEEVWERIHAFTRAHTVDEIVDLASAFRIPCGPVGDGLTLPGYAHFVERGVFVDHPQGFIGPRPSIGFSESTLAPRRPAPALGAEGDEPEDGPGPALGTDPARPLAGVRILDLGTFWAGPVAASFLRVLGADLVKVESHVHLDGMRWATGFQRDHLWEWSPGYHGANPGKTLVALDLTTDAGQEVLGTLLDTADVVIENFSPRVMDSWGVTWDAIRGRNPRAVYLRAPAFGLDGPWRDRVGFAMTMEQVGGLANRTGHPDGPRLLPQGPVDMFAAMHSVLAILLALVDRERTGTGQLIEAPLIEAALQASAEQVVEASAYGNVLGCLGNRSPAASPQGLYQVAVDDRWLAVSIETDAQWANLQGLVDGLDGLDRHGDVDRIDEVLGAWSRGQAGRESEERLWQAGVPAAFCVHPNHSGGTAQHGFRGFLQWYEHPVTGSTPYFSYPFLVDGAHLALGGPAPTLGQHTDQVLESLGLDEAAIARLWEQGVTDDWPVGVPRP